MKKIGRKVCMLAAKTGCPRNGEGAFLRLKDGRILFAFSRFTDGDQWEDHSPAHIAAVESKDEGETWSAARTLLSPSPEEANLMCVSLLRLKDGGIGIFYEVKYLAENGAVRSRAVFRRSYDEGENWSAPQVFADWECYLVAENDRAVRLRGGRIVFPVNYHGGDGRALQTGEAHFFYSDDDGKNWRESPTVLRCPVPSAAGLQETGICELPDGRLMAFSRTQFGCQYTAFSLDGGIGWTQPQPEPRFPSPMSPMCVKNLRGFTAAILNPQPENETNGKCAPRSWGRTPLALLVSRDGFASDPQTYLIEDDPADGYCYTAVFEGEDYFLAAYYHSNGGATPLSSCKIVKIGFDGL